ncbi:Lrp/AsnC family transcriptional regulator [Salmonella enterica subsp. enterica]|nr:Lrp/AsnC family transcriptional regulator [Salmonella enterica subsp. enterica serovar Enteritidis]
MSPKAPTGALDAFDLAILRILQQDNATPQREIGERVHLSTAAVQRRIRRMEEAGIIRANVALIEAAAVGMPLTIIADVTLESEGLGLIDEAKRAFAAAPEVQQCYYVTGEADFVLVMLVATMADYEALTRRLFFENHNVKRFRTLVVMGRVKDHMSVPI